MHVWAFLISPKSLLFDEEQGLSWSIRKCPDLTASAQAAEPEIWDLRSFLASLSGLLEPGRGDRRTSRQIVVGRRPPYDSHRR